MAGKSRKTPPGVLEAMQQLWLAGMSAIATARQEGPGVFRDAFESAQGQRSAPPCRTPAPRRRRGT